jgi:hypothetical protein
MIEHTENVSLVIAPNATAVLKQASPASESSHGCRDGEQDDGFDGREGGK